MRRQTVVWFVPIITTVHNIEEALFMPAFIAKRNATVPAAVQGLLPPLTYPQFLLALCVMTAIPYLVAWFVVRRRDLAGLPMFFLLSIQAMMLINVFAHSTIAWLTHRYAPGLVTAWLINLPFSIYLLRRAYRERWVSQARLVLAVPTGLLFHAIGLPLILMLAGKVVGAR